MVSRPADRRTIERGHTSRATQSLPRLRAAFSEVTQRMANETRAGAPPDVLRLSRELQAEVDRVMGRAGARVLLGTVMLI